MEKMTIGQLAEEGGVTVETVRYYQRRGLMRRPHRPATGYRMYSEDDLAGLRFIKRAQALGFTLEEVREMLELRRGHANPCHAVGCRAQAKLLAVREKQAQLRQLEVQLKALASECRDNQASPPDCPLVQRLWSPE